MSVSIVTATHNRLPALMDTLENKLAVRGVKEVIVVLDGCTDESAEYLKQVAERDARLIVIAVPHGGVQSARRAGLRRSSGDWVLFIDDDDFVPDDYAMKMVEVASSHGAAIVAGPWINSVGRRVHDAVAEARQRVRTSFALSSHPAEFPLGNVVTPFICANFLGRRTVLLAVEDGPKYIVNGWREETDLLLRVWSGGGVIVRSDVSYSWCEVRYSGGQRNSSRLRYETAVAWNELRFRQTNRHTLATLGEASGRPPLATLNFLATRWWPMVRAMARKVFTKHARTRS